VARLAKPRSRSSSPTNKHVGHSPAYQSNAGKKDFASSTATGNSSADLNAESMWVSMYVR
jgi:hypothetical protein